jgi:hypothetical protein
MVTVSMYLLPIFLGTTIETATRDMKFLLFARGDRCSFSGTLADKLQP